MNNFLIAILSVIVALAVMGWSTHLCFVRGGEAEERRFVALRAFLISGLILFLIFATNYYLASTGIGRAWSSEKLTKGHDFISMSLFNRSGLRTNHLLAQVVVLFSFLTVAVCIRQLRQFLTMITDGSWRTQPDKFVWSILLLGLWGAGMAYALWLDTSMLVFRTATMMWPDDLATAPADLPTLDSLISEHGGTMGVYLLTIMAKWYPLLIVLAEIHFASAQAHFSEACRDVAQTRALVQAGLQQLPAPVGPVAVPPLAPVAPAVPVPAPLAGPAPAPGGAAPWLRPIPNNPGPL